MNDSYAELVDIIPFKEDGRWYFKLIYKYEDDRGKHTVGIPKAATPFSQIRVPYVNFKRSEPYIECNDLMFLYDSTFELAAEKGVKHNGCYFDIITEYAAKEMTLDEIEKELGYKVKIVNKEDKENK